MSEARGRGAVMQAAAGSEIRLRPWNALPVEVAELSGEVPRWVRRLWEMRHPGEERVSLADMLAALAVVHQHRLESVAFLVERLVELGWEVDVDGDEVRARSGLDVEHAEQELDGAGVLVLVRLHALAAPAPAVSAQP